MLSSKQASSDHPSKSTAEKLVYMASQIATFFKTQDLDTASTKVAEHILKFWDPRMRQAIITHVDEDGALLDPVVRRAVELLRARVVPR